MERRGLEEPGKLDSDPEDPDAVLEVDAEEGTLLPSCPYKFAAGFGFVFGFVIGCCCLDGEDGASEEDWASFEGAGKRGFGFGFDEGGVVGLELGVGAGLLRGTSKGYADESVRVRLLSIKPWFWLCVSFSFPFVPFSLWRGVEEGDSSSRR